MAGLTTHAHRYYCRQASTLRQETEFQARLTQASLLTILPSASSANVSRRPRDGDGKATRPPCRSGDGGCRAG